MSRVCTKCKVEKPLEAFGMQKRGKFGRRASCKECGALYDRQHKNLPHIKARNVETHRTWRKTSEKYKTWRRENYRKPAVKAAHKNYLMKQLYGISLADYQNMLAKQGGICAICLNPPKRSHLHVDHCHQTGAVRGLLCNNCNLGIGNLKDSAGLLMRAAHYILSYAPRLTCISGGKP